MAKKSDLRFECQHCGYQSAKFMGKCPGCQSWNSMVEVLEIKQSKPKNSFLHEDAFKQAQVTKLKDISAEDAPRTTTGSKELDRVLGGGIVHGSLVLIGGDPGIGKSTLLLQMFGALSARQENVLYISGEESVRQTKLRADRLTVSTDNLNVYAETNLQVISEAVKQIKPSFLVIDSIQTIYHPEIQSAPGSVSQVRECTQELMRIAKTLNIAVFIVGHVTKEGTIAGPRLLEHMVDTVLYFEGDNHHTYRVLRAVKNRFGSTNELGIFEMKTEGLIEVANPSEIFLEERNKVVSGSTIVATMEGTRPLLVEVQALVTPTAFNNPRRMSTGIEQNKVVLLLAVLEKKAGYLLQQQDAYVKVAGGVKLDEPAVDLAIVMAVASSFKDQPTHPEDCFIGEVGLTGEVRRVSRIEQRVQEAVKLGFKRIFLPKSNLSGWQHPDNITLVGVESIQQALYHTFKS